MPANIQVRKCSMIQLLSLAITCGMRLAMRDIDKNPDPSSNALEEATMAQPMIKKMTMLLLIATLTLISAAVSANGQSSRNQIANVPFEFTIGSQTMPAGRYDVAQITSGGDTIRVRSTNRSLSVMRLSNALVSTRPSSRAKLVFHRYGNSYFLAEVWSAGYSTGRVLRESSAEEATRTELSANPKTRNLKYERVEIALARK